MLDFTKNLIGHSETIKTALEKLNNVPENLTLFVVDAENSLIGTLTDGDVRRGLLKGISIEASVSNVMCTDFTFIEEGKYKIDDIRRIRTSNIRLVPLLDQDKKIIRIYDLTKRKAILPVDAVIMAGGRGERLQPYTDTIPKPLLSVGNKPIIEHNIDWLVKHGITNIHLSIRYLGNKIKDYFGDGSNKNINISYIEEDKPLGTIGAISKVHSFTSDIVLLMNSDLLTNIDYEDFVLTFTQGDFAMAIATVPYKVQIPYAILDTDQDIIKSFTEKPTYTYQANGGLYLIKKEWLDIIPNNELFNATDFIQAVIDKGGKVGYYPILGYWLDIGKHEDFIKAQEDIKHLKFE